MKKITAVLVFAILSGCAPESTADQAIDPKVVRAQRAEAALEAERAAAERANREALEEAAAEAPREKEWKRLARVEEARHKNPELDWVAVSISTGKWTESIYSRVYETHKDCIETSMGEDTTCFPIAALPQSYWDAENIKDQ